MSSFYSPPFQRIAIGHREEFSQHGAVKAAIAEFLGTLVFVFAAEGSIVSFEKLTSVTAYSPAGLTAVALAHATAFFVAVAMTFNLSGGHINPAVTLGLMFGGHITVLRSILYWIAQLAGSLVACLLILVATGGLPTPEQTLTTGETWWAALVLEIVITFGLVFTVYATTVDPRAKGNVHGIAPLAAGLIVGANILMAAALSFGSALVTWDWNYHWIYWASGGALAGIIYKVLFYPHDMHRDYESLPHEFYVSASSIQQGLCSLRSLWVSWPCTTSLYL